MDPETKQAALDVMASYFPGDPRKIHLVSRGGGEDSRDEPYISKVPCDLCRSSLYGYRQILNLVQFGMPKSLAVPVVVCQDCIDEFG